MTEGREFRGFAVRATATLVWTANDRHIRDTSEDPAPCAACRARREDGAVRRLRHAGAVPDRRFERASAHARESGPVRRLAYGAGVPVWRRSREGPGARDARRC